MNEDAPTNSAGGGGIAGIGIGPDGEPGVRPKSMNRYKRKNQQEVPSPLMDPLLRRKTFKEFVEESKRK